MKARQYEAKFSAEDLRNIFEYLPDGTLLRKSTGKIIGANKMNSSRRYYQADVCIDGKPVKLSLHRIVWCLCTGLWPEAEIDHIDHDTFNNRIENLRPATRVLNNYYSKDLQPIGKSGHRGITMRPSGKYRVRAKRGPGGERQALGDYDSLEEAIAARDQFLSPAQPPLWAGKLQVAWGQ